MRWSLPSLARFLTYLSLSFLRRALVLPNKALYWSKFQASLPVLLSSTFFSTFSDAKPVLDFGCSPMHSNPLQLEESRLAIPQFYRVKGAEYIKPIGDCHGIFISICQIFQPQKMENSIVASQDSSWPHVKVWCCNNKLILSRKGVSSLEISAVVKDHLKSAYKYMVCGLLVETHTIPP